MDNYERIIGAGNQGDFVLENQQTADREGFSHLNLGTIKPFPMMKAWKRWNPK